MDDDKINRRDFILIKKWLPNGDCQTQWKEKRKTKVWKNKAGHQTYRMWELDSKIISDLSK